MPILLLERLPLPNLKTYTTVSVVLLACAIYYANQILQTGEFYRDGNEGSNIRDEDLGLDALPNDVGIVLNNVPFLNILAFNINLSTGNGSITDRLFLTAYILTKEPWCLVTIINMAYCCLMLFGRLIQKIVFGQLRLGEQQHIKDKFWNFVFYKFIFIFGVMNVQEMHEIVLWSTWFSILGFLHILALLCKDRFEYLSSSPATTTGTHAKVLILLTSIHACCLALLVGCITVGLQYTSVNTFAFMAAECLLLTVRTLYVLVRYGIHLLDMRRESVWENRTVYVYYSELFFELSALSIDFCHHLHMLLWGNIFLSMASLVICMQLRYLFFEFQRRIKRYKNYKRVVSTMEAKFPAATPEDLQQNNDDCAICWEKMETARKLPCGHMFHKACLRSWLEQDTSCPTCRISLNDLHLSREQPGGVGVNRARGVAENRPANRTTDRFHFDGSRYVSWLPSFSVEVTHMQLLDNRRRPQHLLTSQLDGMARSVYEVFPNIPLTVILDDLRVTRSVEITIENIVEGRLVAPPVFTTESSPLPSLNPHDYRSLPVVGSDSHNSSQLPSINPSSSGDVTSDQLGDDVHLERVSEMDDIVHTATEVIVPTPSDSAAQSSPGATENSDCGNVDVGEGCEENGRRASTEPSSITADTQQINAAAELSSSNIREVNSCDAVSVTEATYSGSSSAAEAAEDSCSAVATAPLSTAATVFPTNSSDRERLLVSRKNELLYNARRRYLARKSSEQSSTTSTLTYSSSGVAHTLDRSDGPVATSLDQDETARGSTTESTDIPSQQRREVMYDAVLRRLNRS